MTQLSHHIRLVLLAALLVSVGITAYGVTVENQYFTFTPPDDSWRVETDNSQHSYGARVFVSRYDSRGVTLELARIDYVAGAFDPQLYLEKQVIAKQDVFCHSASDISEVRDTTFAQLRAKGVTFVKSSNNLAYACEAVSFNMGFGTYYIVMAHRRDEPSVIRRVASGLQCKGDSAEFHTTAQYAAAASAVTVKHHLPIGNNEYLSGVELSSDSTTLTLRVVVPYITKEAVRVPAFVMSKREAWFKQAHEMLRFNKLLEAATREKLNLRYFYVDTKGKEICTLLIMPEEYEPVATKPQ